MLKFVHGSSIKTMKFTALAALVACIPALAKAAGTGNPWTGATTFLIPSYVDEVTAAVGK